MTLHAGAIAPPRARAVEWPTFLMILACYGLWALVTALVFVVAPVLSVLVTGVLIAFHASLTHEALHGHPFRSRMLNEVLMALPLNLCIPYNRFRDLHLAHHQDQRLTDPYDDPESNYLDPDDWDRMTGWKRAIFTLNNTLLGRMVIGPILGQILFCAKRVARGMGREPGGMAWLGVAPAGVASVLAWVVLATDMPVWAYLIAVHIGLALLKIRTFLEHQAHEHARARTVIIEDRGPLAFLFLNNNLHVVHHMHPRVPWYRLPGLYRQNKARYLERNDGYLYRSYVDVFARFLFRPKDPVPHPLWHRR